VQETDVRALLLAERAATLARLASMTDEFEEIVASAAGSNSDDEHDPEGSTVAYERAQVAALLREARAMLDDLERALAKFEAGRYGECESCGAEIAPARLAARPAARNCIACAAAPRPGG
jgi:RNA polymerase-binding transcription factor DksA